ncbi:MAG: glycosyltransferase [Thermoplasmata archaeon]
MAGTWPDREVAPSPGPLSLAAGVVAHNEERHLRTAVRSLVDQQLPAGVQWSEIWVVASGCTDGTVEVARALANEEPRVRVVVEPDRGGKARALRQVFERASGDALVLLNSDARAEPGAVGQLVRTATGKQTPFAVMGRPVVPGQAAGRWAPTFRWMWDLHHEFHAGLLAKGEGGHLSDELLLVSLPTVPPVPEGIINDGSYLAVWLAQHAGGRWYAPEARVSIQVPSEVRDHLRQRRRIHVGNAQVTATLGMMPTTLARRFLDQPVDTVRLLGRMMERDGGFEHFARVTAWELVSHALAAWDRLPPRKDHVRWERIRTRGDGPSSIAVPRTGGPTESAVLTRTELRVASLLRVAKEFGTGVSLGQLETLLPEDGPESAEALGRWLESRPKLARLEGPRAFSPTTVIPPTEDRSERAREYRRFGEALWAGPLSFGRDTVRCAAISGSTAFGEPNPGDDLDLFIVTRSGCLWWFLARAYFALLLARRRDPAFREPTPCLNYVLEDRAAGVEFARRSDLLFAREALSVQVLRGDDFYRGLVASAPWMRSEIPRLYDARSGSPGSVLPERAPLPIRLLNLLVFPLLASYLHLAGLFRNAQGRRRGGWDGGFRTTTGLRRLVFTSRRFERLRRRYVEPTSDPAVSNGRANASPSPAAR